MTEALVGLGLMMVLAFLRIPIAHLDGSHRLSRCRLSARLELRAGDRDGRDQGLRDRSQLHAFGGAAVHPDGQLRHPRRHVAGAVSRGLRVRRPSARRAGDGNHLRLRRLRRDLRLLDRHGRDDGEGRLSVDEGARLFGPLSTGVDRRRRNARHPDSALDHHGDLRHDDGDQHRQAVRGRHPAGHPRDASCCASPCAGPCSRTRPPVRAARVELGASGCARSKAFGAWRCCSSW